MRGEEEDLPPPFLFVLLVQTKDARTEEGAEKGNRLDAGRHAIDGAIERG